jgi:hypothetical protein
VSSTYAYVGAKADQSGRGFLGFRQMLITDLQTNIVETVTYRQDYPFITLVASDVKTLGSTTLNSTTNSYAATLLGGTRYQVTLSQTQAASADLDGSAIPTQTTTYQYDGHSNPTQIVVATTDGFSKTTNNTYTDDEVNWILGRLTGATVTSTSPGTLCNPPWGGVISNGQSITAYSTSSVACGTTCTSETRTCSNGTLSGSFTNQSCSVAACSSCGLPWGGTIPHNSSTVAYSAASVGCGGSCTSISQTRTCNNGTLSGTFTNQSCSVNCINVTISASTNNLNLWNYLVSTGAATSGVAGNWSVTIASGVVIGSTSTSTPAFDTGAFPTGSSLRITNNGTIVGAGGNGGGLTWDTVCCDYYGSPYNVEHLWPGAAGGIAIRAQFAVSFTNNGAIWGGGGGGGYGCYLKGFAYHAAGGGGAGQVAGPGGVDTGGTYGGNGNPGTLTTGGTGTVDQSGGVVICTGPSGGNPGLAGSAGASTSAGAAGSAVNGNSFITWVAAGDLRGPLN